jgi:aspartyl protease
MFIPGIDCSSCKGLHTYNLSQSSTGVDLMLASTIEVDFGTLGQVQGEVVADNVLLAQLQVSAY